MCAKILKKVPSRRLLITGAGGFVGPHLIAAALERYGTNCCIIACTYENAVVGSIDGGRLSQHSVDILDRPALELLIEKSQPTHIIHLASISHVPTAAKDPTKVWQVNVMGTLNLLEAMRNAAPDAVLLFVSSSEIYGRSFQSGAALDEAALLQPRNHYAATKAAGDLMVAQYAETGIKTIRVRPFNHIGPGQSADFVVSAFASQIAAIEHGLHAPQLKVGNLDAARDFLDVRDVVAAYLDLLDRADEIESGTAFNICSGTSRPIREMLDKLVALSSTHCEVTVDPDRLRPSDTPVVAGDMTRLKALTGWQPRLEITSTLAAVLDDWRQQLANR